MNKVDWDEYFERTLQVYYQYWQRAVKNNMEKARDKEHVHKLLTHIFLGQKFPEDHHRYLPIQTYSVSVDVGNNATDDYYEDLFKSFKLIYLFNKHKPVAVFLEQSVLEIVRRYRRRIADPYDWDQQLAAQNEADAYVQNHLGMKVIVKWLAFCAFREQIMGQSKPVDFMEISDHISTALSEIKWEVKQDSKRDSKKDSSKKADNSKEDSDSVRGIENRKVYYETYKRMLAMGKDPKIARFDTMEAESISERTLYRAISENEMNLLPK